MRNAILAMGMTVAVVTGQLHAATHKTPPANVGPGRIAWFDITTTNLAQSKTPLRTLAQHQGSRT